MANEKRLIDANAAVDELKENVCKNCNSHNGIRCDYCWADDVIDFLQESPTVYAVEVVHAKWEKVHIAGYLKCNSCKDAFIHEEWLKSGKWNYCPHCGAKMDGGDEDV